MALTKEQCEKIDAAKREMMPFTEGLTENEAAILLMEMSALIFYRIKKDPQTTVDGLKSLGQTIIQAATLLSISASAEEKRIKTEEVA